MTDDDEQRTDATDTLEDGVHTPDGLRLALRRWRPEGPARADVLVVHGYAEHSGRHGRLARYLAARGYRVAAYDLRGHGASGGRPAFADRFDRHLDDLGAVLSALDGEPAEGSARPRYVVGHSMGGAIATLYALERGLPAAGLVLSSPALRLSDTPPPLLQRLLRLLAQLLPHLPTLALDRTKLSHDAAEVARAEADPLNYHGRLPAATAAALLDATHRIAHAMDRLTLPLLVIHGTADAITDPAGSRALYHRAASADKTLALYPGLYHETFNEPSGTQVLHQIAEWLGERVEGGDPEAG